MKTSILLVVEGGAPSPGCLERALQLARATHARLDILLWRGWSARTAPRRWHRGDGPQQAQLQPMPKGVFDASVEVTTHVSFGGELLHIIAEKVEQLHALLVVKERHRAGQDEDACRELIQVCPAPLLLTDARSWSPRPRFAAAVNLEQNVTISRQVIQFASALQRACSADLDLIYVERSDGPPRAAEDESSSLELLRRFAHENHVASQNTQVLDGNASNSLPRFVRARLYDLLAIGRPSRHRLGFWDFSGPTLGDALLQTPCDLLVIHEDDELLATALTGGEVHAIPAAVASA